MIRVPAVWVECLVSPARAQSVVRPGLTRRVFRRLFGCHQPLKIETIWLPFCLLRFRLEDYGLQNGFFILVDGYARLARQMDSADLTRTDRPEAVNEFPYPLDQEETIEIARDYLYTLRMARVLPSGVTFGQVPTIEQVIQYPFLVVYRRSILGGVTFDLVDGLSGKRVGALVGQAFIAALHRRNTDSV